MKTFLLAFLVAAAACKGSANPADCTDKHDAKACQKLCESGGKDNQHFCYAERAFQLADCVDSNKGCDAACKEWQSRQDLAKMGDTSAADAMKGFIGAKYDQMASKCPGAAGGGSAAAAPAGSAAP